MNYNEWNLMNDRALRVIDEYAAAGILVPSARRNAEAPTTLQRVNYLQNRARAWDAAPNNPSGHHATAARHIKNRRIVCDVEPVVPTVRRRATDASVQQSPLDYYKQRAAECTRLA